MRNFYFALSTLILTSLIGSSVMSAEWMPYGAWRGRMVERGTNKEGSYYRRVRWGNGVTDNGLALGQSAFQYLGTSAFSSLLADEAVGDKSQEDNGPCQEDAPKPEESGASAPTNAQSPEEDLLSKKYDYKDALSRYKLQREYQVEALSLQKTTLVEKKTSVAQDLTKAQADINLLVSEIDARLSAVKAEITAIDTKLNDLK
ncbi:MAG: hypothetical protein ACKVH8_03425 [Pirellulales bacterium]|jgi:hypothetical protein